MKKVLFWVRPDFQAFPGGDTVQIHCSARALGELGWRVVISSDPFLDAATFDIVHLWHLERAHDTWLFYRKAEASGRPLVLSPIYWPADHKPLAGRRRKALRGVVEDLKNWVRFCRAKSSLQRRFLSAALVEGWLSSREKMLNGVTLLLPNSSSEAKILNEEKSRPVPTRVIPNVIDGAICDSLERLPWHERDSILCVGHFCPRKNQLGLIEALKGTSISVTFIGGLRPMHRRYFEKCKTAASGQHTFLGGLSHGEVLALMGKARAHVQASTLETPGLVNLEAGLLGCSLVLPPVDPVREYFGNRAHYFDRYEPQSIRKALECAVSMPPQDTLAEHIRNEYGMDRLKRELSEAYRMALAL